MPEHVSILGAGVSGLSAGWKLAVNGFDVTVHEREDFLGGMSSTFRHGDCSLDYGPHKIYTQLDGIYSEIKALMGSELLEIPKKSRIMLTGKYFDFPVRMPQLMLGLNPLVTSNLGFSYMYAIARSRLSKADDTSYEAYIRTRFGNGLYSLIFGPYARKIWGEPKTLAASLAESRVSIPNLLELVTRMMLGDRGKKELSASVFHYPKRGVLELSGRMAEEITLCGGRIEQKKEASHFSLEGERMASVEFADGTSARTDYFVSTIPLKDLVHNFDPLPPGDVIKAADSLRHKNLIVAYLVVAKDRLFDDNWIFFPEERYVFNRIFEQKSFSPYMIPKGKTVLSAEVTCDPESPYWKMDDGKLAGIVIGQLEEAGILSGKEVVESFAKRIENAYPVYDIDHERNRGTVMTYLDQIPNLFSIGRQGYFNYVGMADCLDMGFRTANHISSGGSAGDWTMERKKFEDYQTVD
ncbi:MAG: FAD-dependent oxidoreductase [Candidatus Altiarchaeota archaeon]|nr:FAD-dependent oxidoreductase [Candidatus Altiarchaeota archaeon]